MADRYDPKVTVRPTADRKAADPHPAHNDDPLFELARIVQGRGAGSSAPPPRARSAPAVEEPVRQPPSDHDILRDLEAELLSDLQSSFAAVKEAIEPASLFDPAPKAAQSPPAAAAPAVKVPGPPEPQTPVVPARSEALRDRRPAAAPVVAPPRVFAAARPPIQQAPEQQALGTSPAQPARERGQNAQPVAATPPGTKASAPPGQKKLDIGDLTLRSSTAPQADPTPASPAQMASDKPALVASKPSRWDKPAEPPKPQAPSRFAPPRAVTQDQSSPVQPATLVVDDEEDLPFGEGPPFAHEGGDVGGEFPLDEFDLVPGYGEDVELPPYPEDETETLRKRGVPRSLVAVAGILAVVLIGVLAFVMLRPGTSGGGAPPIIAADAGPTKIAPPQPPAGSNSDQNKLIYDRVDSGSANGSADTKLVTQGNQPIAPVPSNNDANNPIARVIAPGGPAPDAPTAPGAATADAGAADTAAPPADNNDNADSLGPRKVRTVIVKPDGTIVSSDAVPAPGDAPASADTAPTASNVPAVPPIPTNDDTAAIAGGKSGQELPITPDPNAASGEPAAAPAPAPAKTAAAPTPTPSPQPKTAPRIASANTAGPIDLTPGTGKPSTDVASAGQTSGALPVVAGGTLVQVSSQRSEDAANATFRDLQARYPNILGGYTPDIKKIDLGDRGTYYRVRVGPFSSANAQNLCGALKNAGGACILAH
jgi:hypothetical protein